jgi:hypothetical protein
MSQRLLPLDHEKGPSERPIFVGREPNHMAMLLSAGIANVARYRFGFGQRFTPLRVTQQLVVAEAPLCYIWTGESGFSANSLLIGR